MYNNEYEDYMRSILGYPIQNEMNTYRDNNLFFPYRSGIAYTNENNYESLYPEIYKILKPMVRKVCNNPRYGSISNDTLEIMANEIYNNIESDIDVINVNINTKEAETSGNLARTDMKVSQSKIKDEESRICCGNPTLKDLIKIMIIKQLIENNGNRPPIRPRPQFPMPPHRELENPAIYNSDYTANQPFQFYN
ncbi:MAG: hypothetical protein J6K42_05490 [Clostridia bacterium]|nr:hypothetical protein [Clostridia bacterium]